MSEWLYNHCFWGSECYIHKTRCWLFFSTVNQPICAFGLKIVKSIHSLPSSRENLMSWCQLCMRNDKKACYWKRCCVLDLPHETYYILSEILPEPLITYMSIFDRGSGLYITCWRWKFKRKRYLICDWKCSRSPGDGTGRNASIRWGDLYPGCPVALLSHHDFCQRL